MNLMLLLDMAAGGFPERTALGSVGQGITFGDLHSRAAAGTVFVRETEAHRLVYVAPNGPAFATGVFTASWAGIPFVPLNYRLGHDQLEPAILDPTPSLFIAEGGPAEMARAAGHTVLTPGEFLDTVDREPAQWPAPCATDGEAPAVLLRTSGTTSEPKEAILRQRHLVSYVMGTVEFGGAAEDDAALVSVPPYHIAGISSVLSNVYSGRRVVILDAFTPESWLDKVRAERITNAVVVPTMLARIVESLGHCAEAGTPSLRSLVYGGARMPAGVLERALRLFPDTDFVNAYGLTETSSTVAVLDAEDHRLALESDEPAARARLASAGKVVPGIEVQVRGPDNAPVPTGEAGEIWLRGEQISGEYVGRATTLDGDGWYPTHDSGRVDAEGYLFIDGRNDDTIIRGGENIAPAEIEEVIRRHPAVFDVAVVGPEDDEWGQRLAAMVVLRTGHSVEGDEIREWVRGTLRSSKTPDQVVFRPDLPRTDMGKVIRREVLADLR